MIAVLAARRPLVDLCDVRASGEQKFQHLLPRGEDKCDGCERGVFHNVGTRFVEQRRRCGESKDSFRMHSLTVRAALVAVPSCSKQSIGIRCHRQQQRSPHGLGWFFLRLRPNTVTVPAADRRWRVLGQCRCSQQEQRPVTSSPTTAPSRIAGQLSTTSTAVTVLATAISALVAPRAGAITPSLPYTAPDSYDQLDPVVLVGLFNAVLIYVILIVYVNGEKDEEGNWSPPERPVEQLKQWGVDQVDGVKDWYNLFTGKPPPRVIG